MRHNYFNLNQREEMARNLWVYLYTQQGVKSAKSMSAGSEAEGRKTEGRASIEHPLSIHSASIEHPLQGQGNAVKMPLHFLRYVAVLFMVFMVGIGQAWGDTTILDYTLPDLTSSTTIDASETGFTVKADKIGGANSSGRTDKYTTLSTKNYYKWASNWSYDSSKSQHKGSWILFTLSSGTFQTGDIVHYTIYPAKSTTDGLKTTGGTGSGCSTSASEAVEGTITLAAADNGKDTLRLIRVSSNCYINRIWVTRAASCTAPNHVDISGDWDKFGGETISLTATAYSSTGTGSPIADGNITGWQWQKLVGSTWTNLTNGTADGVTTSGATTKNLQIRNCGQGNSGKYRCVVSTGATCSTASATATDGSEGYGVKVYVLECYTGGTTVYNFTRDGENQRGSVEIELSASTNYAFKVHADNDYYGNNGTISADATNWVLCNNSNVACTTNLTISSGSAGGTFTITMDYSSAGNSSVVGEPEISVRYPRKRIYLRPSPGENGWMKDSPKFFIHSWGMSDCDALMAEVSTCDAGVYYADIYASNTGCLFTRQSSSDESINTSTPWNKSDDITISTNNYFSNTGWKTSFTGGSFSPTTYEISFAGNGNTSGSMTKVEDIECKGDVTLEANGFVKTGYTFTGWKDASSNDYANEATISNITADIALTAQWSAKQCTVSFNTNGGSGTITSVTATYDAAMPTKAGNLPTKSGYDFAGFWDGEGGTGTQYYNADGTSAQNWDKNTTSNTTLYAKWTAHVYTVTLNADGGSVSPASISATYQSELGTSTVVSSISLSNYTYAGFYTEVAGGGTNLIGTDKKWIKNKSGYTSNNNNPKWVATSDVTLYAKWTRTVTIDNNGGSAEGSVDVVYKGTAGTPSVPTYAGHTVDLGYYAESGCSTKVMDLNGTLVSDVSGWTNASSKWIQTGTNKLYAHWKCNTPEISCSSNTITISVPSGATVYYTTTTDGSTPADPTSSSTVYNPSSKPTISADTKIKAIAIQSGCTNSAIASADCKYVAECPSSASGETVYKFVTKSSDLGTGNVCAAASTEYPQTTSNSLSTLTGGTLKAYGTGSLGQLTFNEDCYELTGSNNTWLIVELDCAIATGDVIRYVNYASSGNTVMIETTRGTSTSIVMDGNGTMMEQTIVAPAELNGVKTLYLTRKAGTAYLTSFEILRPYTVTLNANTNGGKVGGNNTATMYFKDSESQALPHAFKSSNYFTGWFEDDDSGDAVDNPYTATGTGTLYAQFDACASQTGSLYKFEVKNTLTAGSPFTTGSDGNASMTVGNYLSSLYGGTLDVHGRKTYLTNTTSAFTLTNNSAYLLVTLDCPLQAGDQIKSIVSSSSVAITTSSTRSTTNTLATGTNTITIPDGFAGKTTLYIWRNSANGDISYLEIIRPNGVTITGAVSPDGYGTVSPASIFVASGSTVSLASNVLTCDGKTLTATPTAATAEYTYAFSSWSGVTNGGTVSVATTATANFTRTANNYTLTWNTNGGSDLSGSYTSGSTAYGASITAPNDPTLSNYTFDGWKTNNDGTGTAKGSTMPAANTTYYAAWKQTLTLKTGAQGSGADKTPYVYINGATLNGFNAHSADGYTLQGYYTVGSGGVKVLNADGTFAAANVTDYITSGKWSRTGAAPTLFAQWVASEDCSTSDFVIKKGSSDQYKGCMESSSYDGTATSFTAGSATTVGNAKMTISSYSEGAITRPGSGKTFSIVIEPVDGYNLKSICWAGKVEDDETVSYYWDDESGSATTISPTTTSGTGVTYNAPSNTTKFTAFYVDDGDGSGGIWWRNVQVEVCASGGATYSVTYNGNDETDGSAPTDDTDYSYGAPVTVLGNTGDLAKTNYTFAGWTTNNDGTGSSYVADNTFSITANTTLYAKWTQSVTLNKNGGSTDGSATAVWNATGLTGITHAKPAAGYKLLGYYSASSDGTKVLNSDGTFAATNVPGYITSGKWSRTSATTLYAEYESAGALTWNLIVNSDTANLSTSTKTSAFTEISTTNMTNAALTGLTYDGSKKKSSLTGKIEVLSSEDAAKYASVSFQVASGYKFIPSSAKVIIQPVETSNSDVKIILSDGTRTITKTKDNLAKGKKDTVILTNSDADKYMMGTVTLKIYVYGASSETYRLGTPITIEGEVEEACATMPSYTRMSYTTTTFAPNADASGSPITIVGGTNINTYQWKYNTVNDRTSGTDCGTGTSLTPLTDVASGTRYYWCEMTNDACGITIKSPAVAITVAAAKSDASVTWTDPASTPNYGGGGYTIKATVNETEWDGNAADLVITAPAGIRIYNVTSGTTSDQKWVQADFDVQTSFDRTTYASNIPFTVSAAATATYNAISDEKDVDYSACTGAGEGSSYYIRMRKTVTKDGNYYHCANTDGWISPNISSSYSTGKAGTTMAPFDTVASSNTQYVWVRTYHANVNKVRIYADFRANDMTVSNVYKHTAYFSADSKYAVDYTVVYNGDEENENTGTAAQGYVDITLDEVMAANDILLVKFNDGKVRPLGAIITEGSAGSLDTYLQWSGDLENGATVAKNTTDAYFTYSASKITDNTNTLGTITYSSSNTSVATVDATGKVALVAAGSTTIKATLAASGCYKKAEISYTLNVTEVACAITAGTLTLTSGTESKCSGANVTLTLTGFESGAAIQWKDGDTNINNGGNYTIETDGTTSTLTTDQEGTYSVMVTSGCSVRSNRITISNKSTEVGAKRIVKNWYIKNGRLTPDIELWTLQNGAHLSSVAWSPANTTGLTASDFYESDGKVYLKGKEPSSNTSGKDIDYTLTLTVEDDCGSTTEMSASGQLIYLHHQKNTDKHVLAFVVTGTEKGGFTEGITADQTTSVELYNTIAANFDVLATNVYSTDDEQALKEYYSQFDILCVTDYPNTGTKGVNKKSYVDALGALVDIRPILTMEAFVAKLANWKAKGISGTPQSPTTRQYSMLLQCKDHEIFAGTKLTKVGEGDETMYRVSMVDQTVEEYPTLDGYTPGSKDYNAGGKPALQGFTFTKEMLDDDLLPLGLIDDGSGNDLQVGIERQTEMEARLMVLGINGYAMERLTPDGQKVVVNALKYLMKKNSEDIADCSNTFVGGDDDEDASTRDNWNVASHWSGNAVPDRTQKVRIVAPCVIPANVKPHVTGVIIAPSGKYNHGANTANGSLTIAAGGALIVDGKVEAATAPLYTETRATSAEDLTIQTSSTAQGALIFDNDKGDTKATVEMYSLGRKSDGHYQFQYFAVPMEYVDVNPAFAGSGIYTYVWHEATGWERRGYYTGLEAFEGVGITTKSADPKTYTMTGALASTATKEITLTKEDDGYNLIGNSWTAPIQISQLEEDNSSLSNKTVYIYNAGNDTTAVDGYGTGAGQWTAIPFNAAGFSEWSGLKVIPAMQAFELVPTSEETLTLDYEKVVRGDNKSLTEPLHAPRRVADHAGIELMRIRVADGQTRTDLHLFEGERFSDEFDNGWEAAYMDGDEGTTKLYADVALGRMAVVATDELEGTLLGFAPGKEMDYTFSFGGEGMGYYLNDLKLKTSTLISEDATYSFTYGDGDTNRFYISRTPIDAPQTSTGVDNTGSGEVKARKFIYRDKMYIMINGRVYSVDGALVK